MQMVADRERPSPLETREQSKMLRANAHGLRKMSRRARINAFIAECRQNLALYAKQQEARTGAAR